MLIDNPLLDTIEDAEKFISTQYTNICQHNIDDLVLSMDRLTFRFDGKVFGYWSVRDLVGSYKDHWQQYKEEIVLGLKSMPTFNK